MVHLTGVNPRFVTSGIAKLVLPNMTETRTCIVYGGGQRVVLKNAEVDEFLRLGRELSTSDPIEVAHRAKQ